MLRAVGMTDDDWDKPQVGVASSWNEVTPQPSLDRLAKRAKEGCGPPAASPGVHDHRGQRLASPWATGHAGLAGQPWVIADSVETVMHAERLDAMVTFAGCDKSLPGMLMAAARINVPSVFLYGGSILPGQRNGEAPRHRERVRGRRGLRCRHPHRKRARRDRDGGLPDREGCCAGMFTANTMASVAGPSACRCRASAAPAVDRRRDDFAYASGQAVIGLLEKGIRPARS